MTRSIVIISVIESKTTICLTTSHTKEILLLYDRTIFSMARSTLQKNDFKNQLEEPKVWMTECARRVCVHERVREGNRATVCVSLVVCLMCGFVCVCVTVRELSAYVCACVLEICAQLYISIQVRV
jgi:hypothetical protein